MNLEYIIILTAVVSFIVGVFIGVKTVRYFSGEIIFKLEKSFEEQLKNQKDFFSKSINQQMLEINFKAEYQRNITENFIKIDNYLSQISQKLAKLSANFDRREELELEIIKLKNILKRMEKRDHKNCD